MRRSYKGRTKVLLSISALIIALLGTGCGQQQVDPDPTPTPVEEATPTESGDTEVKVETDNENTDTEGDKIDEPEPLPPTVTILGTEYDRDTEFLDLSECTPKDVAEIAGIICDMPELKKVNLMDEENASALSLTDVRDLADAAPDVKFIYSFELFDQRVRLSDTVIRYKDAEIGNEGEEEIRQALAVLTKCELFVLDDCGIDDEVMAGIRDDFPDTKVVWRVHVGNKSALTDDTVIRMTHGIDDSMTGPLKYCTDTVYMDLGHDSGISDISFVSSMPALECLILSGSTVKELSPLQKCTALTWLELANCGWVSDISPVKDIDSIKYLNISYTKIRDISPIMDMHLDRLCCVGNGISQETADEYTEAHPDCMTAFTGNPWGYAWRYDDHGYHFFSYYARMREVFRYEGTSPGGFKFPEYEEPENVVDEDYKVEEEEPEEEDIAEEEEPEEGDAAENPETPAEGDNAAVPEAPPEGGDAVAADQTESY